MIIMALTMEQLNSLCPKVEGRVRLIKLNSYAETLGGEIVAVTPLIEAGFKHVVVDEYHHTIVSDVPLSLERMDFVHLIGEAPPVEGKLSDGTEVILYYLSIGDDEE